jgi:hypothetical protein
MSLGTVLREGLNLSLATGSPARIFCCPFPIREDAVGIDPLERFLVDFLDIGLEHQAFAQAPAPRVLFGVKALGIFILLVAGVPLRSQVKAALNPA